MLHNKPMKFSLDKPAEAVAVIENIVGWLIGVNEVDPHQSIPYAPNVIGEIVDTVWLSLLEHTSLVSKYRKTVLEMRKEGAIRQGRSLKWKLRTQELEAGIARLILDLEDAFKNEYQEEQPPLIVIQMMNSLRRIQHHNSYHSGVNREIRMAQLEKYARKDVQVQLDDVLNTKEKLESTIKLVEVENRLLKEENEILKIKLATFEKLAEKVGVDWEEPSEDESTSNG